VHVRITVVGAGVVGLTTAVTLQEHGHSVRVVAAATGDDTTSAVAGAVWFPYRVGPPDRVAVWAARTRGWLESLVAERAAGVDLLTGYEITADSVGATTDATWPSPPGLAREGKPWWAAAVDVERAPAPVTGAPLAWRFASARVEPALFLPWLAAQLHEPIERRTVTSLAGEPGDLVVDCAGLAARELARDDLLYPLLGQVVMTEAGDFDRSITITDDRDPDNIFYAIPRRDELVLGGCSIPWPPGAPAEVDDSITRRILDHAGALGLSIGAVRRVRAGLRPYRLEVRLERDGRIIHNYGHGGAGYTLSRGCADDVAALVTKF
jgi:D-amino-acid oxidase